MLRWAFYFRAAGCRSVSRRPTYLYAVYATSAACAHILVRKLVDACAHSIHSMRASRSHERVQVSTSTAVVESRQETTTGGLGDADGSTFLYQEECKLYSSAPTCAEFSSGIKREFVSTRKPGQNSGHVCVLAAVVLVVRASIRREDFTNGWHFKEGETDKSAGTFPGKFLGEAAAVAKKPILRTNPFCIGRFGGRQSHTRSAVVVRPSDMPGDMVAELQGVFHRKGGDCSG